MNNFLYSIKEFCGKIIIRLTELTGSPILAVVCYVIAVSVICYTTTKKNCENIFIGEYIARDFEILQAKKNKKDTMAKDISNLTAKYKYNTLQPILCFLEQVFFGYGLVVGYSVSGTETYSKTVFGLELDTSVLQLFKTQSKAFPYACVFVLVAVFLQMFHDAYYEKYIFSDNRPMDCICWIVLLALCVFNPMVFTVYWMFHEIVDIGILIYIMKFGRKDFESRYNVSKTGSFTDED